MRGSLTDVAGLSVGHWTDLAGATGCTVVLCPEGAIAGVDVRGSAPGTRELDLLDPVCTVERVHAVLIGGGSAFGLAAADGVMRYLEERGIGVETGVARVPIVPAAILFDLGVGRPDVRPDAAAGYAACMAATTDPVLEGNVGAGTGASAGKLRGLAYATKTGVGSASVRLQDGATVAALVAVNAVGNIYDPHTHLMIAGTRSSAGTPDSIGAGQTVHPVPGTNTTLAVVATDCGVTKSGATRIARMAHDGLARTIRPVHTSYDGDTVFALSYGSRSGEAGMIGAAAAEVLAEAVARAVYAAETLSGLPAARDAGIVPPDQ